MTDSPKNVSEAIAEKPADTPASPPKNPADGTKTADAPSSEQKPAATPAPLET